MLIIWSIHSLVLQGAYSCYCLLTACTVGLNCVSELSINNHMRVKYKLS